MYCEPWTEDLREMRFPESVSMYGDCAALAGEDETDDDEALARRATRERSGGGRRGLLDDMEIKQ